MPDLILEQPCKVTIVESIIEQIIYKIQVGRLKPDNKLPPERQFIAMLNVGALIDQIPCPLHIRNCQCEQRM